MHRLSELLATTEEKLVLEKIRGSYQVDEFDFHFSRAVENTLGYRNFTIASTATSVGISVNLVVNTGKFRCKLVANEDRPAHYQAVVDIQRKLLSFDFPCTVPIADVVHNENFSMIFEEFNVSGEYQDSHNPAIMSLQAESLAKLHSILAEDAKWQNLRVKSLPRESIWIPPHSPIFDFSKASDLTKWIDQKGTESRAVIDSWVPTRIISHSDWSNKHFRFHNKSISVIYDWDSLCVIDELYSVGLAAATFTATWEFETRVMPSPEESRQFVKTYEGFRGRLFSRDEFEVISAYSAHMIGYWGRCIVALNPQDYKGSFFEESLKATSAGMYF